MDLVARKKALEDLKKEVAEYAAAERKRLNDERDFLTAIRDRSTGKITATHTAKVVKSAQYNVQVLVGLDVNFNPDQGVV